MFFYLVVSILPLTLFIISIYNLKHRDLAIGSLLGYVTSKSSKSREKKLYGQKFAARLWLVISPIVLFLSNYSLYRYGDIDYLFAYILIFQLGLVWLGVIPVDLAIGRHFSSRSILN